MKKKKNKAYPDIVAMIAQHYERLYYESCSVSNRGNYNSRTREDIFCDTVLYVIHDPDALSCTDVEAFIRHFKYRFRMIEYQNSKQLKEIPYADYKQTQKEEPEGGER
jgi:hypothetical protein